MADSSPPSSVAGTSRPTRRRRVATMEEEELSPRGSPELISINQLDVADIATKNVVDASPQQQHLLPTRDQQRTSIRRGVEMDGDLLQRTVHRAMDVDDSSYYRNHDASCNNDDVFVGEDMLHNTSSILIRSTRNDQPPATTKQRRSHDADELIDYLHHLSRCAARGRKQMKSLRHQDIRSYRAKLREERRRAPPPQRSVGKHSAGHHRHVVDDNVGVSHEEALELVEYLRTLREEVEDKAPSLSKRSTKTSSSSTSSPSSSPPRTLHSDSVAQPSNSSTPSSSARDGDGAMNIVDYVRRMRAEDDGETPPRNHPPSSSVASSGRSSKRSNPKEKMDGDDDGPSMASTRKPSSSASSTRTPRELHHTDIASTAPPSMPATLEVPSDDDLTRGPHPSTTSASANDPSAEEERSAMAFLKQLQEEAAFGRYAKQQQEQEQEQRAPSSTDATPHDVNASLPRAPQANKPETCSRGVQYMDDVDVGHRKNTLDSTGYVHSSSPIFSSPRHPHTSASPLNARDSDGRRTSSRNQITTPEVQGSSSANKHVQLQLPLPQRHSSLRSASAMGDDRSANASARRRTSSTPLVVSRSSTAKDIIWSMPSERVLSAMASTRSREASLDRSARSTTSPRGESDGRRTSSRRRTSSVDAATDPIPSPMKHPDEDARIIPSPPQHTVNDEDRNQHSTTNISISSVLLPPSSANQSLAGALPPLRLAQQHVEGVVPHVHACSSPLQRTHSSAATSPPPRASSETPPVNDDVLNAQRAEVRRRLTISTSELRDEAYGALSGINTIIAKRLLRRAHRRKLHPPRLRPLKDGGSGVVGDVDAAPPRRSGKKQQQQHDAPQSTNNEAETLVAGPPQQHRKKRKKKNAAHITDAQQTHEAQPPPPTVPPLWSTTPTPTDPVMMNAANTNKQAPSAAAEMVTVQPGKNLPLAAHVPTSAPHDASTVVAPEKMVPSSSSSPAAPTPTTMDVAPSAQDAPTTTPPPQHDVPPTSSISPRFPPTTDDGQPTTSTSSANHLPHNHNTSLEQPPHLTSDDKNTLWHSHPSLLAQSGSGRLSQLPLPTGVDAVDGVIHQRSRDTSLRSSPRISAGPTPRPQDSETVGDDGDVGAADANNNDGEVLVYFHRDASSADTTSASMSVPKLISPRDLRQPTPRDAEEMREEVRRLSSRSTMSPDTHDALSSGLHRDSSRAGPASPSVSGSDDDDDDDESPPIVGALEPPHGTDSSSSASSKSPPPSVCSTSIGRIKTNVGGATKNMDDDDDDDDGFSPRSSPSPTPSPTPTTHGATDASSYNSSITARPHPRSNTPTHVDGDEGDHLVDAAHADEHATDDGVPTLNDPNMYEDAQSSSSSANSGVDDAPPHTIATRSSAADGDGAATSSAHMKDPHARPSTADTQAPPHEAPTTTTATTMLAPSSSVMYAPTTQVDEPQKVVETKAIVIQRPTPTPHDELPSSTPHTRDDAHGTTRSSNYTTDSSDESEEEEDDDVEEDGISSTAEEAISHETSTIIRHTSPRGDGQQQQHPPTHEDKNPVYIPKPNYVVCGPTPPSMEQIHGPSSSSSPAAQPQHHEEDDEEDEDEEEDEEEEDYADVDLDDVDDDLYQDVEPPSARKHAAAFTRGEGHPHSPLTSSAAALNHLPSASPNTRNTWRAIGRQQQQQHQPLRRYPQYMPTRTTTTTTMPVPRTSNSPPRRHDDGGVAASLDSFAEPLKRSGTAEGDRGEVELADTLRRADSASPPSHDASRCALPNKSSSSTTAPTTTTATTTAAAAPPSSSSPAFTTVLPHDDDDLASAIVVAKAKRPASTSSTHSSTGTDSTASSYVPLHERRPQKERTFSVPTINVKDNTNNNSGSITSARRPKKVKVCSPTRSQRLQPSSSRTASNASSTGSSTADASAQHRRKHKHRKQAQPPTTSSPGESAEAEAPPSSLVVRFSRRAPSKAHATSPSKKKQRSATRSPSSNPAPPQDTPPLPTTTITPTKMKKKLMKPKPSPHVVAAPIPHPPSTPKLKVAVRGAPRTTTTTTIKATRSGVRTPQKPTAKIPVPSQHAQPRRRKDPLPPHTSPPRRSTPTTTTPSLSSSPPAQLAPTTPRSASASSHRSGSETPKKKAPMRFSPLHRRASDVDDSPRPSSRKPIIPDEARGRPRSSPQRTINVLEVPHNDDDHLHERRKPPIPAMFHRRASAVAAMELAPQKKKKRKMMANIYSGNAQRRRRRSLKKRMRQPPPLMLPMDLDFADSAKAYALIHTPSDDDDDGNDDTRKHATPSSPAANSADQSDAHQRMSVLECVNQRLHILNPQEIQRYLHHADPLLIGSTSTKSRGKKKKHARTPREKRISAAEEDDPYAYLLSRHGFWGEHRPGL